MNSFKINGKHYVAKPFDFNTICDLEDLGVSVLSGGAKKKPTAMTRAYFALHLDGDTELAGKEIEAHIVGGGTLEDMMSALNKEIDKSDFFRSQRKDQAEEDSGDQGETKEIPGEK